MSNNKQSMKLYTEEQVREMLENAGKYPRQIDFLLENLTPIELPSDEEILKQGNLIRDVWEQTIYMSGAKWVRDKIQGGNNENN
jgi:hypothetical protein